MAMCAEHRSEFAALRRQWWRLYMNEKFSSGTINSIQTNKQTNNYLVLPEGSDRPEVSNQRMFSVHFEARLRTFTDFMVRSYLYLQA